MWIHLSKWSLSNWDQDGADALCLAKTLHQPPDVWYALCFGPLGTGRSELDVKAGLGKSARVGWAWAFPPMKHLLVLDFREVDLWGKLSHRVLIQISQKAQPP